MKKLNKFLLVLTSSALLLGGCPATDVPDTPSGGGDDDPSGDIVAEEYAIVVNAPSTVDYSLSKSKAKRNEEVVLTINSVSEGFSLKNVTMNSKELTAEADGKTYKFTMPNRSVNLTIRVTVDGDIVIAGDFTAAFADEGSGLFVARNVSVDSSIGSYGYFDVEVGSTKLKALDLDESVSFGDIEITYGATEVFRIASGSTYDFFYDESKSIPFSVQRVRVDTLPDNNNALASILVDGYAVRSEPAMFMTGLTGATYNIKERTTADSFEHNFAWKRYLDNVTYATIQDVDEDREMVVYRHYDETNKTFSVVDTYALKVGEVTVNDDRYRASYNNYGAYSARYDVIDGEEDSRFEKSIRSVNRELSSTSHHPAYVIERDLFKAYRSGLDGDEVSYSTCDIASEAITNGFKTTVDTLIEYDSMAGTYTTDHHEAIIYDIDMTFDVRGALTSLALKKRVYTKDQWDFTKHEPLTGQTGSLKTKIDATYTYGEVSETCTFDPTPYFISSVDEYKYVNKAHAAIATNDDSYIGIEDKLYIQDNEGFIPEEVTVRYSPNTALDLWQYGPTASSDTNVMARTPSDVYYQMSAINEGDAVVTITNHVSAPSIQGAVKDVTVHVIATTAIRSFYIQDVYSDPSYASVDSSNSATVHANGVYKFSIASSPSAAPLVYEAVSQNTDYLTIKSAPNSKDLIIDTTGAKDITKNVSVRVTITSTRYDDYFADNETVFIFHIMPAQASPFGIWDCDVYDDTQLVFTEEVYSGDFYKGYIRDHYFTDDGQDLGENFYYFYFKYDGSHVDAYLYGINLSAEFITYGATFSVSELYLEFYYEPSTGRYGVFLAVAEYDDYYEDTTYYPVIFGNTDDTGLIIKGFTPFTKRG